MVVVIFSVWKLIVEVGEWQFCWTSVNYVVACVTSRADCFAFCSMSGILLFLLLLLALQPAVGFGLSNNSSPFVPMYHQLSIFSLPTLEDLFLLLLLHLFLGLPLHLIPSSSWVHIFLGILSSSILSRWPSQSFLQSLLHMLLVIIHFTLICTL